MSGVVTAAVVVGGATVYAAHEAGKSADKAMAGADAAAQLQFDISQQQIDLANEQWDLYKDEIYPLEVRAQEMGLEAQEIGLEQYKDYYAPMSEQFATEAMEGVEAQPERAARDARLSVDQAFDSEEGMMQRNLERRGVRPGSGNYESEINDTSLSRAASKGFTVNRAVEAERDRVEDVNFNRKAVALGRTPTVGGGAPGINSAAASYGLAAAGNTAQGAGSQYGNIAGQYGSAAGNIVSGGVQLGMQAYDMYNKYSTPSVPTSGYNQGQAQTGTAHAPGSDAEFAAFKDGGQVKVPGYANGGQVDAPVLARGEPTNGGMVNGPSGVDNVPAYIEGNDGVQYPAKLSEDEFVIPADVVKVIGTGPLDAIIEKARNRKQAGNNSPNALTRRVQ